MVQSFRFFVPILSSLAVVACSQGAQEIASLELMASEVVEELKGERLHSLLFRDQGGRDIHAYLREPVPTEGAQRDAAYPGVVLAAGRYAGREAAAVIPGPLEQMILAVEYPADIPERMTAAAWMHGLPRFIRAAHRMPGILRGAGHYLAAHPLIDSDRMTLVGVSFGVPFAAAAGHDRVFTGVALHFGGADIAGMLHANLPIENGMIRGAFAKFGAWVFRDLEPARHVGAIAPTPLLLINGSRDEQIPESSALLLAERATQPMRHIWLHHGHLSSQDSELLRELADSTFRHFDFTAARAAEADLQLESS